VRIVLDLQTAQAAQVSDEVYGQSAIALAQAVIRNRGAHEILIVLSDQFQTTIEPIRAAFFSLLPDENICVWRSPHWGESGESTQPWHRKASASIREAFLVSLEPDLVHLTWPFGFGETIPVISIGTFTQSLPTAVTVLDSIALAETDSTDDQNAIHSRWLRQIDHLKRAHLLLAATNALRQDVARVLGLPSEQIIDLSSTHCNLASNREEQDFWDQLARQALQSFEHLLNSQSPIQIKQNLSHRPKQA
jgi:hypothetical protein